MATTEVKIITLEKLGLYDGLVKKYVDDADAKSIKSVAIKDRTLKFYKVESPSEDDAPAYSFEIPETDLTAVTNAIEAVEGKIGTLDDLTTTSKTDLVVALNEVAASVEAGGTGSVVKISTDTTTEGYAKSYTFTQGSNKLGVIDIPKDMVVSSGTVETDPEGQDAGTYLVLTLANATNDKIYINVGKLVDIYKAAESATQVQITVDSSTREISATIVAGSVTATELATDSVITTKIADGNVTKAKLSTEVQASLGKADTAIQEADLTDLKADVAANKASLGTDGATTKAIADAKKAGTDAQTSVNALAERVGTIESTSYVEATDDEIKALFA